MNPNIFEAIKSDNLDLFKLLFDYRRILDDIITNEEDYTQLIYETYITTLFLYNGCTHHTPPKNKDYLYVKEIINSIKIIPNLNNAKSNVVYNKFKFLFNPSKFLDLCIEFNSIYIFTEYMNEIVNYNYYYHDRDFIPTPDGMMIYFGINIMNGCTSDPTPRMLLYNKDNIIQTYNYPIIYSYPLIWDDPRF